MRNISKLLVATLVAVGLVATSAEAASADTVVLNGGFEDGFTSWAPFGQTAAGQVVETTTAQKHGGSNSAHLVDASTAASGGVNQLISVDADSMYRLSVWGLVVTGSPRVVVEQQDSAGATRGTSTVPLTSSSWEKVTVTMGPVGSGTDIEFDRATTQIRIGLYASAAPGGSTQGEAYFDDLALEPFEWLENGGFEAAFGSWNVFGASNPGQTIVIDSASPHSGASSVRVVDGSTSSNGGIFQNVDVNVAVSYSLSFWGRAVSGAPRVLIRQLSSDSTILDTTTVSLTGSGWSRYGTSIGPDGSGADVAFDDDTESLSIMIIAAAVPVVGSTGEMYVDDVALTALRSIRNGGFEGGLAGWTQTGGFGNGQYMIISGADYHPGDGTSSLLMRDASSKTSNATLDIDIDSSQTYAFSIWVKNITGSATVSVRELAVEGEDVIANKTTTITASSGTWADYTRTFGPSGSGADVVFDAGTDKLRIILNPSVTPYTGNTGEAYFDDVSLVHTSSSTELVEHPAMNSLDDWHTSGIEFEGTSIEIATSGAESGTKAVRLTDDSSANFAAVSQEFAVDHDESSLLSLWAKNETGSSYAYVRLQDRDRNTVSTTTITIDDADWTHYTRTIGPAAGSPDIATTADTAYVLLILYSSAYPADANTGSTLYDQVDLQQATPWVDAATTPSTPDPLAVPSSAGAYTDPGDFLQPSPVLGPVQPEWFTELVQAHTAAGYARIVDGVDPADIVDYVDDLGLGVMTVHTKTGGEGMWYPTAVPDAIQDPAFIGRDVVDEYVTAAHASGMKLLAYQFIHADRHALLEHPEWACRGEDDHLLETNFSRGYKMCIQTEYRYYAAAILAELVTKGVDGIYLDVNDFTPNGGCFNVECRERFALMFPDEPFPTTYDPQNPQFQKLQQVGDLMVLEAAAELQRSVTTANPDAVLLMAGRADVGAMDAGNTTVELATQVSAAKIEFKVAEHVAKEPASSLISVSKPRQPVELAMNMMLFRDAGNKLPHVWSKRRPISDAEPGYAKMMYALGVTDGYIMNFHTIFGSETEPDPDYLDAMSYADSLAPYVTDARYLRWAVVQYSERLHDSSDISLAYDEGADEYVGQNWGEFYWPILAGVETLMQNHVPMGMITDDDIAAGRFDNVHVVVIPHPDDLSAAEEDALADFELGGGVVIRMTDQDWHDPSVRSGLLDDLWTEISTGAGDAPIEVSAPPTTQAGYFRTADGKLVVSLLNDTNWMDMRADSGDPDNDAPPVAFNATITLRGGVANAATLQPAGTALTITTSGGVQTIEVTGIADHALIVLDGSF